MARIRTIKPEFFSHEGLFDLEQETGMPIRLAFAGLWSVCDREGRFKWRPRAIKSQVLPYDDVDFSRVLDALTTRGFVVKYASGTEEFGYVPGFARHQAINNREVASSLPAPPEMPQNTEDSRVVHASATRQSRDDHAASGEGKGREGKGTEGKESCTELHASPRVVANQKQDPSKCRFPTFPCSGQPATWEASPDQLESWADAYPAVDIEMEHRAAHAWVLSNLDRRKTARGMAKFLNSWLAKSQNRARSHPVGQQKTFAQLSLENTMDAVRNWTPPEMTEV